MFWKTLRPSALYLIQYSGLRVDGPLCDVIIVARQRKFGVHRSVISKSCSYFSEVLLDGTATVTLGDIHPDVVMYCLTFIYSGVAYFPPFNELDEKTALEIHYLVGVKLCLTDLLDEFYNYLIESLTTPSGVKGSPDSLLFVLRIGHTLQDAALTARMKAHIVANLDDVFGRRPEGRLDLRDLLFVLTVMEDWTEEADIYKLRAIISWIRAGETIKYCQYEALIKKVEYANLDQGFVDDVVLREGLLDGDFSELRKYILGASLSKGSTVLDTRRSLISDIVVCNPETTLIRQWDTEENKPFNVSRAPMFPSEFLEVTSHRGKIYAGNGDEMWIFNGRSWRQVYPAIRQSKLSAGRYNRIIGCGEYVAMVTCGYVMVYNTTTSKHSNFVTDLAGEGFCVASSGKSKIFVIGGSKAEDAVVQFDLKRERLKNLRPMTGFKDRGTAFYMDETVVVFGRFTRLTMCYDVKRKKWDTLHFNWKIEGNTKVFVIGRNLYIYEIDTGHVKSKTINPPVTEFLGKRAVL